MAVYVGSARIDEHGQAHGGMAGDQKGGEVATQKWYLHAQGSWRVFRPKDKYSAEWIARDMQAACDNPHIGYDQYQRDTLYNEAKKFEYDCALVEKDVETDCSALVRVCCMYAGIDTGNFRTYNEPRALMSTGCFCEMVGSKYQKRCDYLKRGDILVTPSSGHTVVVLSDGKYADSEDDIPKEMDDMEMIKYGSRGAQVRTLQRLLNAIIKADLEVDGDYGPATRGAVIDYQSLRGLEHDGVCGTETWKQLLKGE
jgi:hypothetical protein